MIDWIMKFPLSERLLAADSMLYHNPGDVPALFLKEELDRDMGAKYYVGVSKLMTKNETNGGA